MDKERFRTFAAGWVAGLVTAFLLWMLCDFFACRL